MKRKVFAFTVALILIGLFSIPSELSMECPASKPNRITTYTPSDTIVIGVIGPVGLPIWDPAGMKPAAEMAAKEINDAGGINVGGKTQKIQLLFENEWAVDPITGTYNTEKATTAVTSLLTQGAQFIIGGWSGQVTSPIIETVMDWNAGNPSPVPFFIVGTSDELIRNLTDAATYARYKWLFRIMPVNGTTIFGTVAAYIREYILPTKLVRMYGSASNNWTVKYAVVVEDFPWTTPIEYALTTPATYRYLLGPNATCVYHHRAPAGTTDFTSTLAAIESAGAHLIIHVFSAPFADTFVSQVHTQELKVLVVGIDVFGQLQSHWADTGGACYYEILLSNAGTATPIVPGLTDIFWKNFMGNCSGEWPLYTAFGAYDAIYALKEAIEKAGSIDPYVLLPFIEGTDRIGLSGRFKYTAWHDVYSESVGPLWPDGYTRAMMVQWINGSTLTPSIPEGVMTVVTPMDQPYSRKTLIPPWMYALAPWDIDFDGQVNIKDIAAAAVAFGTFPRDKGWNTETDTNIDGKIDIKDIASIARHFGESAAEWPLP